MGATETEVIGAVAGRDVHKAGALVHRDEIAGEERHVVIVSLPSQGMYAADMPPFQLPAFEYFDRLRLKLGIPTQFACEALGNQETLAQDSSGAFGNRLNLDKRIVL